MSVIYGPSRFTDHDIYLFKQGSHYRLYEKLGAHEAVVNDVQGVLFSVWAPNAERVSVIGDFNGWNRGSHPLEVRWDGSGIWEGFVPGLMRGLLYKYFIQSRYTHFATEKADPYAFHWETPPKTGTVVWNLDYVWQDQEWMSIRKERNALDAPMSVYEIHLGSWRRSDDGRNWPLSYRELADQLPLYVNELGFTHVEFLPVTEHPFYGSWGYQTVGYFAPTSRYGTPQDFMYLVDKLHQHGIGVILDIVPSHFPTDAHALANFDGTHLFEHSDPRKGFHPDWNSAIFNYSRNEVRNFLISGAIFWLDKYHIDGLRVDAVASMLYLDYSRKAGEWIPNVHGGRENLEAITLLQRMNEVVYEQFPDVQTIAEESTAYPMVSRPVFAGGLGFGMKWNMGWMHDTLAYFMKEPVHRKFHQQYLTFSLLYAFSENFQLPLSHDEVVHGKSSLLGKMPGDLWQKRANLRLLLGYLWTHPGKKLLFMGAEIGQWDEWSHDKSLDWHLLGFPEHEGIRRWVSDLNQCYRTHPALYQQDFTHDGFRWVDCDDTSNSVISFLRFASDGKMVLVVLNCTPVMRESYRIGAPIAGKWREILNSDADIYGGSGKGNLGVAQTNAVDAHGFAQSLQLVLPPLSIVIMEPE